MNAARALLALLLLIACRQESGVVDRGGRSMDVPVPSSGTAAEVRGSKRDIDDFPRRAKQDPSRLRISTTERGMFIVDAKGRSLYAFSGDEGGQPACLSKCEAVWPPAVVDRLPGVETGIDVSRLAIITRADGKRQLSYANRPLYYAESDHQPGDTWGHNAMSFSGRFTLVAPNGDPLQPPG
jgi:predicted lipoprotein with Yx(FWY)xxD motif